MSEAKNAVSVAVDSIIILVYNSGHLRHDYLVKYAYFVKCHLERFASMNDPER